MNDTRVKFSRKNSPTSPDIARNLERVAWLMDRAIKVPGTNISIGLDALLGLVPLGGDLLTGLVQAGLVVVALYHYRVPRHVAARMMGNVLLDIAVGSVPLVGDLFDVAFKANTRNLRLLDRYRHSGDAGDSSPTLNGESSLVARALGRSTVVARRRGMPWRFLIAITAVLVTALALVIIGLVTVIRWLL
jgi:hypothetical protein